MSLKRMPRIDFDARLFVQGEVDIVEGVNDVSPNQATLHTGPGLCPLKPRSLPHVDHCHVFVATQAVR